MILPVSQTSLYLPSQLCTNGSYHSTSFLVSAISKKNWLCSLYMQMLFLDVIVVCKLWISRHVQYDWMQSYFNSICSYALTVSPQKFLRLEVLQADKNHSLVFHINKEVAFTPIFFFNMAHWTWSCALTVCQSDIKLLHLC